jgi:hypothetical protein
MRRWRRPTWRSAKRRAHCRGRRVDPNLGPIVFAIPLIALGFLSWPTQGLLMSGLAIAAQQREKPPREQSDHAAHDGPGRPRRRRNRKPARVHGALGRLVVHELDAFEQRLKVGLGQLDGV